MAPKFTMEGHTVEGLVVKVYDGDTVTVEFAIPQIEGSPVYRWSCRVVGIDTAEMLDKDPAFKALAVEARDLVREMCLDKKCKLDLGGFDKYGRVLVTLYEPDDDCSVADVLVAEGYAFKYDGGTKASRDDWEKLVGPFREKVG